MAKLLMQITKIDSESFISDSEYMSTEPCIKERGMAIEEPNQMIEFCDNELLQWHQEVTVLAVAEEIQEFMNTNEAEEVIFEHDSRQFNWEIEQVVINSNITSVVGNINIFETNHHPRFFSFPRNFTPVE